MKTIARLALFGVAALLAVPANAQMTAQMQSGQGQPFQPGPGQPELEYPYAPPPGFAPPDGSQPQQAPVAEPAPQAEQGPEIVEVPEQLPAADLAPDDAIADTYDDGYDPQAYTEFEQALDPYGSWVDDPGYGRVWEPAVDLVGDDFAPYATSGHWILTEYGWTWISDFGWGWAPFHYGRWLALAGRGWCWMPGTTWGPAWVSWRAGGGYVGWAPLPPRGVSVAAGSAPHSPWRFAYATSLGGAHPTYVSARQVPGLFARTTVVANDRLLTRGSYTVHVNAGPVRGATMAPVRLATVAPRALPKLAILPRTGASIGTRPWMQASSAPERVLPAPTRALAPQPARRGAQPWNDHAVRPTPPALQPAHNYASRQTYNYAPQPTRHAPQPAYRAPQPTYRAPQTTSDPQPTYRAPQPTPTYREPQPASRASQPIYREQEPAYRAPQPAYRTTPASQATYNSPHEVYRAPQSFGNANAAPTRYVPQSSFHAPAPSAPAPQTFPAPATHFGNGGGGGPRFEAARAGGGAHFGGAPAGGGGPQLGGGHRR